MGALFDAVRSRVSAEDAARFYGLNVTRWHKAVCPWHPDHNPSLSFSRAGRCKCFVCGNGGSCIDIAAQLLGLSLPDAARRINADFRLGIADDGKPPDTGTETPYRKRQREEAEARTERNLAARVYWGSRDAAAAIADAGGDPWEEVARMTRARERLDNLGV